MRENQRVRAASISQKIVIEARDSIPMASVVSRDSARRKTRRECESYKGVNNSFYSNPKTFFKRWRCDSDR
jgi:hypothetical protein